MNGKRPTVIHRIGELTKDVDYYAKMFPNDHNTLQEVIDAARRTALEGGGEFGLQVSNEWEDKCYCFDVLSNNTELLEIEYLGIGKA